MFTVGICDENLSICKKMESCIVSVLFDECDCKTVIFTDLKEMLDSVIKNKEAYDFLFVPIMCNDDSGLKFASVIRENNYTSEIVFTAFDLKNVLDGYIYRAFDFFIYPVSATQVKSMFNRYFMYNDKSGNFFYVKKGNRIEKFDKYSTYYFYSNGRKITMISAGNPMSFYSKLDDVENDLAKGTHNFVRAHQSYLINVQYIKTLTRDNAVMDNGDYIPVSRKYQNDVKNSFLAYLERRI